MPDGKRLLVHEFEGGLSFHDPGTGLEIFSLDKQSKVVSFDVSGDGGTVALSPGFRSASSIRNYRRGVLLSDLGTLPGADLVMNATNSRVLGKVSQRRLTLFGPGGEALRDFAAGPVSALALSPDGGQVVMGTPNGRLQVLDAATGTVLRDWIGHQGRVRSIAFTADGQRMVTASSAEGTFKVWDSDDTPSLVFDDIRLFRKIPQKQQPATHGDKDPSPPPPRTLDSDEASGRRSKIERLVRLFCLAVRPDGRQLAFGGGRFQKQGELYLLDFEAGAQPRPLQGHTGVVLAVAFSPDGQRLVSASAGADVEEDACPKAELFVWDVPTGRRLRELQGLNDAVVAAAFSPDGVTIAAICLDQTLRLWDTTDACRHVFHGDARGCRPDCNSFRIVASLACTATARSNRGTCLSCGNEHLAS